MLVDKFRTMVSGAVNVFLLQMGCPLGRADYPDKIASLSRLR